MSSTEKVVTETSLAKPQRYTWKTFLQAVFIALVAQVVALVALRRVVPQWVNLAIGCGITLGVLGYWGPQTKQRRYWLGFVVTVALTAVFTVFIAWLFELFDSR